MLGEKILAGRVNYLNLGRVWRTILELQIFGKGLDGLKRDQIKMVGGYGEKVRTVDK